MHVGDAVVFHGGVRRFGSGFQHVDYSGDSGCGCGCGRGRGCEGGSFGHPKHSHLQVFFGWLFDHHIQVLEVVKVR